MGQFVVENAHLNIDREKYAENWERVFGKKCDCHNYEDQVCDICQKVSGKEKDKAEANAGG